MGADVWLITGVQASGKSTVAELLSREFAAGVHVRGGQFYRWVTRGWTHASDAHFEEARRLLELRYRLSARVADEYCAAGFTTVVQDNIYGDDVITWFSALRTQPRHLVVLRPSTEVVARREQQRQRATGKVAYRPGEFTIDQLDAALASTPRLGLWLDTSRLTPEETVSTIWQRRDESLIDDALANLLT